MSRSAGHVYYCQYLKNRKRDETTLSLWIDSTSNVLLRL
jgi:hypothetical protein